jgi:CubicO group peptidase (beta-lactamase class C family)
VHTTRRRFTGGALSLAFASSPRIGLATSSPSRMAQAIGAIGYYADANVRYYNLPAVTPSVTTPDGLSTTINRGYASLGRPQPIAVDTLFQIGSITKSMTAAVIHQLAAEGRLDLHGDAGASRVGSLDSRRFDASNPPGRFY